MISERVGDRTADSSSQNFYICSLGTGSYSRYSKLYAKVAPE